MCGCGWYAVCEPVAAAAIQARLSFDRRSISYGPLRRGAVGGCAAPERSPSDRLGLRMGVVYIDLRSIRRTRRRGCEGAGRALAREDGMTKRHQSGSSSQDRSSFVARSGADVMDDRPLPPPPPPPALVALSLLGCCCACITVRAGVNRSIDRSVDRSIQWSFRSTQPHHASA